MKALDLFDLGYTDLVSVIPPDAPLSPSSKIAPEARGKSPGLRNAAGLWHGYNWRGAETSRDDAERMDRDGANVGLRAGRFPALDLDVRDEPLAAELAAVIEQTLPTGPVRVGAWPKRLYPFRLLDREEPIRRMQVILEREGEKHLLEILGEGQQYVIAGIHPRTGRPYDWTVPLVPASQLPTLTSAQADALLDRIVELFSNRGFRCERVGTGRPASRTNVNQEELKAEDLDLLERAVRAIPNTNATFPSRADYIRFGYAIRGATQDDPVRGLAIFQEWAARWDGGTNDPATVAHDWETFKGPYELGADYIFHTAQRYGFDYAQHEFAVLDPAPPTKPELPPIHESELWAARTFVNHYRDRIRWVPQWGKWVLWQEPRWRRDELGTAFVWAEDTALRIADYLARQGVTPQEQKRALKMARAANSKRYIQNMMDLAKGDKRIVTPSDAFDADPWLLGTPGGVIDLRTGELLRSDPKLLVSRITSVAPVDAECPVWTRFLRQATGDDREYIAYIQRFLGYSLTGLTVEHLLHFVFGLGGNGKSVFLETVAWVMGEYATTAPMDAFTETRSERHPTDLAGLQGARLVTASETKQGRKWDEQRVKSLTGGDRISARFMRQDFFQFTPTFKLLFAGNYQPELRNLDDAMRRRFRLLPFTQKPPRIDPDLKEKLKREGGEILSWMLKGCALYQSVGLGAPPKVVSATEEYFCQEDAVGRWIAERLVRGVDGKTRSSDLYADWRTWCDENGEDPGTQKSLSIKLKSRDWKWVRDVTGTQFLGVEILPREAPELADVRK